MNTVKAMSDKELTLAAEHAYEEQRNDFIISFKEKLKKSIEVAKIQIKNGQKMNFSEFKKRANAIEIK